MCKWMVRLGTVMLAACLLAGCTGQRQAGEPDPARQALLAAGQAAGLGQPALKVYAPKTMYEAIDGEADLFKAYGVRRLISARFGRGMEIVEAEIFDQGQPLLAYGVFSSLASDGTPARVGAGAVTAAGETVRFWQHRYFVRVSTAGRQRVPLDRLLALSQGIAARLPRESDLPAWTRAKLPPGTRRYVARNVLGYGFLSNAMVVETPQGPNLLTFALCQAQSEQAAARAFAELRRITQGRSPGEPLESTAGVDECLLGTDPGLQPLLAARVDSYVAVAAGPWQPQKAAQAIRDALASLPGA